jgi:hypothetical protein
MLRHSAFWGPASTPAVSVRYALPSPQVVSAADCIGVASIGWTILGLNKRAGPLLERCLLTEKGL